MVDTEQLVTVWMQVNRSIRMFEAQLEPALVAQRSGELTPQEVGGLIAVLEAHRAMDGLILKCLSEASAAASAH